jgi:hypothetical protein
MNEDLYRLAMLGLCVVFMPLAAYHRFRAHTGEKLDRWQEGTVILFGLRLTGVVLAAAGLKLG